MNHAGKRTCVMSVRATVNRGDGRGRTGNGNGKKKKKQEMGDARVGRGMHVGNAIPVGRETRTEEKKHAKGRRNPRRNEGKIKKNRIEEGRRD